MSRSIENFNKLILGIFIRNLNFVSSLKNGLEIATHSGRYLGLADNDDFSITLFAYNDSIVLAYSQSLDLFSQGQDRLRCPLIFINRRVSSKCHIFPKHQSTLPSACHQRSAAIVIDNTRNFISCHIDADTVCIEHIKNSQIVVFISLQVPEANHIFIRTSWKQTFSYPNRT